METIIKNYLNYIQNICIIKKILFLYSHKPRKRRIYQLISEFVYKVNGGERWSAISWKLDTFYSKITLTIINKSVKLWTENCYNYENSCFSPGNHTWRNCQLISQWSPIYHFHDELQKSGENSSVCVVSGNLKKHFPSIIQMFCM